MIPLRRGTIFSTPIRLLVYYAITVVDPAHVGSTIATLLVTCFVLFLHISSCLKFNLPNIYV